MRRRYSVTGILTAAAGLALLAWIVEYVGVAQVVADFRQVGWGIIAIVAIGGLRFLMRAVAWRLCLDPPHRLRLADAFAAVVCGDTIGNITPLGPLVGEPAKAAFVRGRVALGPAVTALAIENVLYTLSAAAMIASGMLALLFLFELPAAIRDVGEIAIAATIVLFAAALWLLWRQPALISRALAIVARPERASRLQRHAARVRDLEAQIYTFVSRHRSALPAIASAELGFHALGVGEVFLTLWLLYGAPPALLTAFILETTNRLITVVFRFVPLRLGVDEAATALFTQVIGLGANIGVTLGIVRKARVLAWTIVGAILLTKEGLGREWGTERANADGEMTRKVQ